MKECTFTPNINKKYNNNKNSAVSLNIISVDLKKTKKKKQ